MAVAGQTSAVLYPGSVRLVGSRVNLASAAISPPLSKRQGGKLLFLTFNDKMCQILVTN